MPVAGDHHHEVDFAHRQVNTGLGVEVIRHARWSARSAEVRVVRANRNRNFVDSLLEEAVRSEPVSEKPNSLFFRENTGNFIVYGPVSEDLRRTRQSESIAYA